MQVYLWPLLAFFLVGAAGAIWQALHPVAEAKARDRVLQHSRERASWERMPLWNAYHKQMQEPERIRSSAKRRAAVCLIMAGLLLFYLLRS